MMKKRKGVLIMKTIGLLGGMSWESTQEYYRIINEEVRNQKGGTYSAKCLLYSFNFNDIEKLQHAGGWDGLKDTLIEKSQILKEGGADFLVICTNTMHVLADDIEEATGLKVLHIADATGAEASKLGMKKVGLLGTRYTMEGDFYKGVLINNHNIEAIVPEEADKDIVHQIIYEELVQGKIKEESKQAYIRVINNLVERGAEGIVLGCTEIPLLIKQDDVDIPVLSTTDIHAKAVTDFALK